MTHVNLISIPRPSTIRRLAVNFEDAPSRVDGSGKRALRTPDGGSSRRVRLNDRAPGVVQSARDDARIAQVATDHGAVAQHH
jgi:hypothetical protein